MLDLTGHIPLWFYLINNIAFFLVTGALWYDLGYRQ